MPDHECSDKSLRGQAFENLKSKEAIERPSDFALTMEEAEEAEKEDPVTVETETRDFTARNGTIRATWEWIECPDMDDVQLKASIQRWDIAYSVLLFLLTWSFWDIGGFYGPVNIQALRKVCGFYAMSWWGSFRDPLHNIWGPERKKINKCSTDGM